MPIGKPSSEQGLLLRQGGALVLQRDDGGCWRLEADGDAWRLLGARVRVEGVRSGFDRLDVRRIERC
jgi:hypothetical protein